jgi:3-deoxy-D-manno-octulosonic-acid transferase
MLAIYRFFIVPLITLSLPFLGFFNRKIAAGLRLRRKSYLPPEFNTRPIWIHASSGEFEYAKSLIREIKTRWPELPVVVTYFSPTYARNVENFPGVDFSQPLPLDLPGPCISFLRKINPRVLLIARTDFWPELLSQTRARQIPIHVFSYTQRDPGRMSRISRFMYRWRLQLVDQVHCVSPFDLQAVQALLPEAKADQLGDTRYDQVRFRLDHPKSLPEKFIPRRDRPVLIAGSTWPEDEAVLLPALQALLQENKLRLVLVPHEPTPEHVRDLRGQLEKLELNSDQVLLVDEVGWLAEIYAYGDMAFIGGSFRKTVHSVMEALGAGLMTFVGPKHLNNREAIEFQHVTCNGIPAVTVVNSAGEWESVLQQRLNEDFPSFTQALKTAFGARLGGTVKLLHKITGVLDQPSVPH